MSCLSLCNSLEQVIRPRKKEVSEMLWCDSLHLPRPGRKGGGDRGGGRNWCQPDTQSLGTSPLAFLPPLPRLGCVPGGEHGWGGQGISAG